ncbi:MAG: class I SAM-dependent methyltransferase [Candidatus Omnitrophica bacterium]|nr:class I SAM-dependent methyltransferase [Candidatus Omnitrophota bacterium]
MSPINNAELHQPCLPSQREVQVFYDLAYRQRGLADLPPIYRRIIRLLQPIPGRTLLDVACGEGHLVSYAHEAKLLPTGIDLSSEAIHRARARCPQAMLIVSAGEALPFRDASFDYVTNLGSLEHFRDMDRGLREMARVLAPDGTACLVLPNGFWLGDVLEVFWRGECSSESQVIERHSTRQGWQQLLGTHGFLAHRILRYNRPYPLFAGSTWKVKSIRKFIWRRLFNALTPFNLSLEFIYLCRKRPTPLSAFSSAK